MGTNAGDLDDALAAASFRAVVDAADRMRAGVVVTFLDRDVPESAFINAGAVELIGYSREELTARTLWSCVAPDALPRLIEIFLERKSTGLQPTFYESALISKDGRRIEVEIASGDLEIHGRPASVAFIIDVSSRAVAQRALAESESLFKELVDNAPDGILILRGPRVLFANAAARRLVGGPDVELIGRNIQEFILPDDRMVAEQRIRAIQKGKQRHDTPALYRSRLPDGLVITVEITSVPIEYEGGPAVLSFARDVSERRRMEEQLLHSTRLATLGTLAAGVAHEVNNPLAYMLPRLEHVRRTLPELAERPELLAEMLESLEQAIEGARRVEHVVADLRTFAAPRDELRADVELVTVLESAVRVTDHARGPASKLEVHVDVGLTIHANPLRLEQVLVNLLINASHAVADRDEQSISIKAESDASGAAVISIRDTGCGMTTDELQRAFEPFFSSKPGGVGTGLGLPICETIVRDLGGEVTLSSELGVGTTATIRIPRVETRSAPSEHAPDASAE